VRAKLVVNYDYHDYPRDEQLLRMEIELESSLSDDVVTIVPSASIDILPSDEHPVWKMVDVQTETLRAMPYPFASEGKLIPRTPAMDANPAYTFIRTEFERGAHSGNAISQGVVIFRVIRDLPYYIYNYVLIEAMLVALGFTCFTINRDATDVRLTIAMGLVLSINVFQVVLVENIPETGYLTRLTRYTVFNEGLLIIISMHAVLIGHCHKVHERLLEVRELLRIYSRQRGQQAVIRLQRAFRRFRAARRAGRALRSSAAHSPTLEDGVVAARIQGEDGDAKGIRALRLHFDCIGHLGGLASRFATAARAWGLLLDPFERSCRERAGYSGALVSWTEHCSRCADSVRRSTAERARGQPQGPWHHLLATCPSRKWRLAFNNGAHDVEGGRRWSCTREKGLVLGGRETTLVLGGQAEQQLRRQGERACGAHGREGHGARDAYRVGDVEAAHWRGHRLCQGVVRRVGR